MKRNKLTANQLNTTVRTIRRVDPSLSSAAATLGRKGGSATTPAKVAASAANGRKGGRPQAPRVTCDEALTIAATAEDLADQISYQAADGKLNKGTAGAATSTLYAKARKVSSLAQNNETGRALNAAAQDCRRWIDKARAWADQTR